MTVPHRGPPHPVIRSALLMGGDQITTSSGGFHDHIYPATGQPNAIVALAGAAEIDHAVTSAWQAHKEWMSLTVDRRRDLLIDLADAVQENFSDLARLNVHDYAVPVSLAGNAILLERFLRYFAGYADKPHGIEYTGHRVVRCQSRRTRTLRRRRRHRPLERALVVAGSCVAPALAAGNAVVFKPSELAPLASLALRRTVRRSRPATRTRQRRARRPRTAGKPWPNIPGIGKLHFTGSGATARKVLAIGRDHPDSGGGRARGKVANIVFADADLDTAAMLSAHQGPLIQSGQSCACGSRLLVHESIYDTFAEKLLARHHGARRRPLRPLGDVRPRHQQGRRRPHPAGNRGRRQRPRRRASHRRTSARRRTCRRLLHCTNGFRGVDNSSTLAQTETFGPVVSLIRFSDDDEAVRIANDTPFRPECLHPHPGPESRTPRRSSARSWIGLGQQIQRHPAARALRRLQAKWVRPHWGHRRAARVSADQKYPHRHGVS